MFLIRIQRFLVSIRSNQIVIEITNYILVKKELLVKYSYVACHSFYPKSQVLICFGPAPSLSCYSLTGELKGGANVCQWSMDHHLVVNKKELQK